MHKIIWKNILALALVVIVLLPLIAEAHALGHLSDVHNDFTCEQCEFVTLYNQPDFVLGNFAHKQYLPKTLSSNLIVISYYNSPVETIARPAFVLNKPPPIC